MIELTLKLYERLYVGNIEIQFVGAKPRSVQLGITAPREVVILREELIPWSERKGGPHV